MGPSGEPRRRRRRSLTPPRTRQRPPGRSPVPSVETLTQTVSTANSPRRTRPSDKSAPESFFSRESGNSVCPAEWYAGYQDFLLYHAHKESQASRTLVVSFRETSGTHSGGTCRSDRTPFPLQRWTFSSQQALYVRSFVPAAVGLRRVGNLPCTNVQTSTNTPRAWPGKALGGLARQSFN